MRARWWRNAEAKRPPVEPTPLKLAEKAPPEPLPVTPLTPPPPVKFDLRLDPDTLQLLEEAVYRAVKRALNDSYLRT